MTRKFYKGLAVWVVAMTALMVFSWRHLSGEMDRLDSIDAQIARCGELRLGMDQAEAVQLMGQVQARFAVASSTPGFSDTQLRFDAGDPGVALWARLDGRSGRLVEAACGSFHLRADQAFLRSLAPSAQSIG